MVSADQLTPEQAKALLVKRQEQSRARQREFSNQKRAKGYKRINAFLSPRAYAVLDRERERTGNNVGDVLSAILEWFDEQRESVKPNIVPRGTKRSANALKTDNRFDRAGAMARIMELSAEGFSHREIAERLTAEGIATAKGGAWNRGTVGKIISAAKKGGDERDTGKPNHL